MCLCDIIYTSVYCTGEGEVSDTDARTVDDIVKGIAVSHNNGGESAAQSQGSCFPVCLYTPLLSVRCILRNIILRHRTPSCGIA